MNWRRTAALQVRDRPAELLDLQPGDAQAAAWDLDCTRAAGPAGTEVKGPDIQGRPGERFIYLNGLGCDRSDSVVACT